MKMPAPATALTAATLTAIAWSAPATAATITTATGTLGADNQINGFGNGRADLNKGGATTFDVRGNSFSGNNFYGVLRFDLSSLDLSNGVDAASLRVTLASATATGGSVSLLGLPNGFAGGTDERDQPEQGELTYTEGTQNFTVSPTASDLDGDNAPGFNENGVAPAALGGLTPLGTIAVPANAAAGTQFTFSPAALRTFVDADTNNAVVFYLGASDANTFLTFSTREAGAGVAPALTVEPTAVPEPATAAGLALAGGALLLRRRHRLSR
jgi:hypothetical protein